MKSFRQAIIDMYTRIPSNVVIAYKQGKEIECRSIGCIRSAWISQTHVDTNGFEPANFEYRVKPTPALRPWRPEEVPVGALTRVKEIKYLDSLHIQMITYVCPACISLSARKGHMEVSLAELLTSYVHSLDHGKTWLPCGVEE